ncbi:hypothetical protein PUN28_000439 [Cardiocondyla obscurior]|uniref:Lipoprotein n=1 Tax=Cardiocondyla obscurior TaxID=286306 RepID=A0AAW2GZJ8_9HYME
MKKEIKAERRFLEVNSGQEYIIYTLFFFPLFLGCSTVHVQQLSRDEARAPCERVSNNYFQVYPSAKVGRICLYLEVKGCLSAWIILGFY